MLLCKNKTIDKRVQVQGEDGSEKKSIREAQIIYYIFLSMIISWLVVGTEFGNNSESMCNIFITEYIFQFGILYKVYNVWYRNI